MERYEHAAGSHIHLSADTLLFLVPLVCRRQTMSMPSECHPIRVATRINVFYVVYVYSKESRTIIIAHDCGQKP